MMTSRWAFSSRCTPIMVHLAGGHIARARNEQRVPAASGDDTPPDCAEPSFALCESRQPCASRRPVRYAPASPTHPPTHSPTTHTLRLLRGQQR